MHERLAAALPVPPDSLLTMTVGDAVEQSPFFKTWAGIRALWAWIKHNRKPTPPTPPAPTDPPAWRDPVILDQGNYGTCVGNGWAGWLASDPVMDPGITETVARAIYYESTVIGGSPDDPDAPNGGQQGSTVRDGAKAVQARGRLSAYAFATSLADVREWLNNHGPVVFGTDWFTGMFYPDPGGWVNLTGKVEGGHCYLCVDYDATTDSYEFVNSWGDGWGVKGHFRIRSGDLAMLLAAAGEACLAAELPL